MRVVLALDNFSRRTVGHDFAIQEREEQQGMPHFEGGVGYQPVAVYWAKQHLAIADEYRDGNVPAGTNPVIRRSFQSLPTNMSRGHWDRLPKAHQ